jgi:hypothetical protein
MANVFEGPAAKRTKPCPPPQFETCPSPCPTPRVETCPPAPVKAKTRPDTPCPWLNEGSCPEQGCSFFFATPQEKEKYEGYAEICGVKGKYPDQMFVRMLTEQMRREGHTLEDLDAMMPHVLEHILTSLRRNDMDESDDDDDDDNASDGSASESDVSLDENIVEPPLSSDSGYMSD